VAAVVALAATAVMLLPNKAATAVLASTLASLALAQDMRVVGPEAVWTTMVLAVWQAQPRTAAVAGTQAQTALVFTAKAAVAVGMVTALTPETLVLKTAAPAS
jgi:hypothetical protein